MSDLIERATKAVDLFDAICKIHDPSVSAHDRRVQAMAKVLEAAPSPSPAPGVVEALQEAANIAFDEMFAVTGAPVARAVQQKILALASLAQGGDGGGLYGEYTPIRAAASTAIPANPAQVTDAIDRLEAIIRELAGEVAPDGPEDRAWAIINDLRAALTAAIGAGGQAVAAPDAIYAELRAYFERYPTEADEHLGMLACKLSAIAHPVPMEWRLVPEEPTPEMIGAFWRQKNTGTQDIGVPVADKDHSDHAAYRAMLSAAPQPKGE